MKPLTIRELHFIEEEINVICNKIDDDIETEFDMERLQELKEKVQKSYNLIRIQELGWSIIK